jgi:hypothetical protein
VSSPVFTLPHSQRRTFTIPYSCYHFNRPNRPFNVSARTLQERHYVCATKPNRLMLLRQIFAVCCENRKKNINTLCAGKLKNSHAIQVETTMLWRVSIYHLHFKWPAHDIFHNNNVIITLNSAFPMTSCIFMFLPTAAGFRNTIQNYRPLGRPRRRWVDNIKMNLREIGWDGGDWINLAQDRD